MDLNSSEFATKEIKVFNNGDAGKVKNVEVKVEKRKVDEPETHPDYKLIFTDENGGAVNMGVYYWKDNAQKTDEQNAKNKGFFIQRLLSVAKSLLGNDFKFPAVKGADDAVNVIMTLIAKESKAGNNKLNLFTAYGTELYPKKFLTVRFFDFVEAASTPDGASRLKPKRDDVMVRPTDDGEQADAAGEDLLNDPATGTKDDFDFL